MPQQSQKLWVYKKSTVLTTSTVLLTTRREADG